MMHQQKPEAAQGIAVAPSSDAHQLLVEDPQLARIVIVAAHPRRVQTQDVDGIGGVWQFERSAITQRCLRPSKLRTAGYAACPFPVRAETLGNQSAPVFLKAR